MEGVARFILGILLALTVTLLSCFIPVEPIAADFICRLFGGVMMFLLGIIYNEWARSRRNKDE